MNSQIEVGTRFQKAAPPHFVWEVTTIVADPEGLPHARLARVDSPSETRVISLQMLGQGQEYQRLPDGSADPVLVRAASPAPGWRRILHSFLV